MIPYITANTSQPDKASHSHGVRSPHGGPTTTFSMGGQLQLDQGLFTLSVCRRSKLWEFLPMHTQLEPCIGGMNSI
jgi:hypothetical protein